MNRRQLLQGLLLLALLVVLGYLFEFGRDVAGIDPAWIDSRVRGHGVSGEAIFVGVAALSIALGMPRQSLCFLGGYAFGFLVGAVLALCATLLGSIVSFCYARVLARDFIRSRFTAHLRDIDKRLSRRPFLAALLLRLLPVGNNLATNLTAGVASVRPVPFFAGSTLGYVPQTVVFALAGSGLGIDPMVRLGLSAALFLISGVLGISLYQRYRRDRGAGPAAAGASLAPVQARP